MNDTIRREVGRAVRLPTSLWRWATAPQRPLPDFVIIGAQRAGTTSLYKYLCTQQSVARASRKEVHYFDVHYDRGERWYKSHFDMARPGTVTGEASPYMLFHPLAPERAAHDLSDQTRFIALLREPVDRAISQYWHERKGNKEAESLERAIALESERLAGTDEVVRRGERSYAHQHYSYVARGEYAGQLRRWFDAVGRERVLVLECERVYADSQVPADVLHWLGLPPSSAPYPSLNAAARSTSVDAGLLAELHRHFEPHNEELFELLGTELWTS
jgi:hypothetical protein